MSKKGAKVAIDEAQFEAAKARMQSKLVKGWVTAIEDGKYGHAKVADALRKVIEETRRYISNSNSPEGGRKLPADSEYQLQKYRDALILLNVLEGKDARESASVNRNVGEVAPVLTGRVHASQTAKKANRNLKGAAAALTRKVERAEAAAASAAARANALRRGVEPPKAAAAAASKAIVSPDRLGRLIATKGRNEERAAMLDTLLDRVKVDSKTPKYISDVVEALRSQALRFNRAAKRKLLLQLNLKVAEIEGQRDIKESEGGLTKAVAAAYESKLKTLRALIGAVDTETNVELSNESRASTTGRKKRTHKRMSCKILRHPCNSKVIVTKEQLKAAVDEILEKGWATPIPGTASASASAAASRATSAAPSAAPSNEEE